MAITLKHNQAGYGIYAATVMQCTQQVAMHLYHHCSESMHTVAPIVFVETNFCVLTAAMLSEIGRA